MLTRSVEEQVTNCQTLEVLEDIKRGYVASNSKDDPSKGAASFTSQSKMVCFSGAKHEVSAFPHCNPLLQLSHIFFQLQLIKSATPSALCPSTTRGGGMFPEEWR
ncbi:hypothetical protein L1887_11366 [Cichorium endivia]|nr:hypothetical protein L1887_11366 [Cichorium endivia]